MKPSFDQSCTMRSYSFHSSGTHGSRFWPRNTWLGRCAGHQSRPASKAQAKKSACHGTAILAVSAPGASCVLMRNNLFLSYVLSSSMMRPTSIPGKKPPPTHASKCGPVERVRSVFDRDLLERQRHWRLACPVRVELAFGSSSHALVLLLLEGYDRIPLRARW